MSLVFCFENDRVVGMVEYTANLDHWDGNNNTCGSTGRHLGIGKTKDGRFYVCHGTQWEGERNYADIISKQDAKQMILQHNPDAYEELIGEEVRVL